MRVTTEGNAKKKISKSNNKYKGSHKDTTHYGTLTNSL